EPTTWSIPEGVREVIDRRLARLGAHANRLLQAAAVLGGSFSFQVLRAMTDLGEATVLDAIDEALNAGILAEEHDKNGFTQALIRETVYAELSVARRQHLHLQAADAMESLYGQTPTAYLGDIADHYRLAGSRANSAKAIQFALRAGQAASDVFAYERALEH